MKPIRNISIFLLIFGALIYVDIQQRKPDQIQEEKTFYPRKKVKDWNNEEVRASKRLWLEKLSKK